jgi:outer membrane cobalamin receptor
MKPITFLIGLLACLSVNGSYAYNQPNDLSLFFDLEDLIIMATQHPQSVHDAPAIASVISAKEIRQSGARNIQDVLSRLPGFEITLTPMRNYQIELRGMKDPASTKIKFMVDGHTVQDELTQSVTWIFESISLDNVKRIEVIRGPASTLYGTSAFAGIINIITNNGDDVNGIIATTGVGSFNTRKVSLQLGNRSGDIEYALFVNAYESDGDSSYVEKDKYGQSGYTDYWQEQLDIAAKISYKDWHLKSRYLGKKRGPYVGLESATNSESELQMAQYFVELSHEHKLTELLSINSKVFLDRVTEFDQYWQLLPDSPLFSNPNGMVAHDTAKMEAYGGEVRFDYQLADNNMLTLGLAAEHRALFNATFHVNFNPDLSSKGALEEVKGAYNWIDDTKTQRDIWAIYLQDIWTISEQVELTSGLRHDQYSDFGGSTNPKVAAVWKLTDTWRVKAHYAKGFKAPTYAELYIQSNPSQQGNPDLEAETTDTYEASLSYARPGRYEAHITYFNIQFDNMIQPSIIGNKGINGKGMTSEGVELEWRKRWKLGHALYANYTWQDVRYASAGHELVEDVARSKGNIGFNYKVNRYLNLNLNTFITGDKPRATGDTRDDHKGYSFTDATFIVSNIVPNLEVQGSIKNLFNKALTTPSVFGTTMSDSPLDRRSFNLELRYTY